MNEQHHAEIQQTGTAPCLPMIIEAHRGGVEIVDRLANEWRELCIKGSQNQPFFRPEWIAAVLSAFESKDKLSPDHRTIKRATARCLAINPRAKILLRVAHQTASRCGKLALRPLRSH